MSSIIFQYAGPWGIVGLVVGAVVFGRLVPRSLLKETRTIAQIWREAYEHERAGRVAAEAQRDRLLVEYAPTATRAIQALPAAAAQLIAGRDPGGNTDVAVVPQPD